MSHIITTSEISLPQSISMTIKTSTAPPSGDINQCMVFRNFKNESISLPIKLTQTGRNQLEITGFPDSLHNLQVLGSLNHRSYWDRIFLQYPMTLMGNSIDIDWISMTIHYVRGATGSVLDIPVLSRKKINLTLVSGGSELGLTSYMRESLMDWAGIKNAQHEVAIMAVHDLGKSGTSGEGYDGFGDNPKYRGIISTECAEFVSWYFHQTELRFATTDETIVHFRDITDATQLANVFKVLKRSYVYDSSVKKFLNEDTDAEYTPKAGDYLGRLEAGKCEHAMMMLNWDPATQIAKVINGPYPVTLRDVNIYDDVTSYGKDYVLGSIW